MRDFNPQLWFGKRHLDHLPSHFIKSVTPATIENLEWVKTKLTGRYTLIESSSVDFNMPIIDYHSYVYFEDPKEAMLFELRWSGGKNN